MLKCPNCGSKIPFYKPWLLTTNSSHITCSSCGKKLYANRKINYRIGLIGSISGIIIMVSFKFKFDLWTWMIIILWFLCCLLASTVFTRFELKK